MIDRCPGPTENHENLLKRISSPLDAAYLNSPSYLRAELNRLAEAAGKGLDEEAKREIENRRAAADSLIDPLTTLWTSLQTPPVGEEYRLYKHTNGTQIVELQIKSRLGDTYHPLRAAPAEPVRVATIGTRAPTAFFSMGISTIFGKRTEHSLETLTGEDQGKFRVITQEHDDVSFAPTGFFTVQHPGENGFSFGGTLGVGISGDLRALDETTDVIVGITPGLRGAYLTIGIAYTSDISKLPELGEGSITTDPNILNRAERTRELRFVTALHIRP